MVVYVKVPEHRSVERTWRDILSMFSQNAYSHIQGSERFRCISIRDEITKQVKYDDLRMHIKNIVGIDIGEREDHERYADYRDAVPEPLLLPERTLTSETRKRGFSRCTILRTKEDSS